MKEKEKVKITCDSGDGSIVITMKKCDNFNDYLNLVGKTFEIVSVISEKSCFDNDTKKYMYADNVEIVLFPENKKRSEIIEIPQIFKKESE